MCSNLGPKPTNKKVLRKNINRRPAKRLAANYVQCMPMQVRLLLPSNRLHPSYDVCLEVKREDYRNCLFHAELCRLRQLGAMTCRSVLQFSNRFSFVFVGLRLCAILCFM